MARRTGTSRDGEVEAVVEFEEVARVAELEEVVRARETEDVMGVCRVGVRSVREDLTGAGGGAGLEDPTGAGGRVGRED